MLKKFLILFCVAFSGACSSFDGDGLTNGSYSQGKRLDPNCDHFYGKKLEGILPYVQLDTMKTDLMMIISELIPV